MHSQVPKIPAKGIEAGPPEINPVRQNDKRSKEKIALVGMFVKLANGFCEAFLRGEGDIGVGIKKQRGVQGCGE